MHVEEREAVRQHVVARPLPHLAERVQVGRHRAAGDQHPLRRPGGAGRVEHERGRLAVRFGGDGLRFGVQVDRHPGEPAEPLGERFVLRGHDHRWGAVPDDVLHLPRAHPGVDRYGGGAGQQHPDDAHARLQRRGRPHGHPFPAGHASGDGGAGVVHLAIGQRPIAQPEGLVVDGFGDRREQHGVPQGCQRRGQWSSSSRGTAGRRVTSRGMTRSMNAMTPHCSRGANEIGAYRSPIAAGNF